MSLRYRPLFTLFTAVLALLATLCPAQQSFRGTFIIVIPANGGIVVAADTRTNFNQTYYCDGHAKILVPKVRKHTVVFFNGDEPHVSPDVARPPSDHPCEYMKSSPPVVDINKFLAEQVDLNPQQLLTRVEIQQIAERCRSKFEKYRRDTLSETLGKGKFVATIVSYDVKHEKALVGTFVMSMDSVAGEPGVDDASWIEIARTDPATPLNFGETEYVEENANKLDRALMAPYLTAFRTPKKVAELSLPSAKSAAQSFVKAVVRFAKITPPPRNSIGGPVDLATITKTKVVIERQKCFSPRRSSDASGRQPGLKRCTGPESKP